MDGYNEDKIAQLAAQLLDPATKPPPRSCDAKAIIDWLRQGARRALAVWHKTINVADWDDPDPEGALAELATSVQPQWPLVQDERHQVGLDVVGVPRWDEHVVANLDGLEQLVAVSTLDRTRLIYAPTRHGLYLRKLAAVRALWESHVEPDRLPDRATIHKTLIWHYAPTEETERHHNNLVLSRPRYRAFRAEPRPPRGRWASMAIIPARELNTLASSFYTLHAQREWTTFDGICNVLAFVQQCISYEADRRADPTRERPRYPLETLVDGLGDSADRLILAAAVLKRLGYDVALLYYAQHCALGVEGASGMSGTFVKDASTGVEYFYGEITTEGWSLGQLPPQLHGMEPEGIEVVPNVIE
jgi:hypothetical protein